MGERLEIEIPPQLTEPLLQYASETELPVEDIVETALRNYLERSQDNSCHVHPESIDKTIDEMESRWYDATHRQTEAEKMVEDYNNGLTVLNDASLAYVDTGFGMTM